jgi:predicted enzyme related to lactoylglutathione lyase
VSEVGQHVEAEPGQAHLEHRAIERHGDGWEQMRNAVGSADRWDRGLRSFANLLNTPAALQSPLRGFVHRVVPPRPDLPTWQDCGVERVTGIGGYFVRATDPAALGAWYRDCLGLDADENGLWRQGSGPTVFAAFESETDYFGSRAQRTMINFRVRDLDAMLAQLRLKGADVAKETQDMEGVGRFGWVTDPEGNRIELWQPN